MKNIQTILTYIQPEGSSADMSSGILYFLLENRLFGHECISESGSLFVTEEAFADLCTRAGIFAAHSGDGKDEKTAFLMESLHTRLPETASRLEDYFSECGIPQRIRYRLLDWAACFLHTEVRALTSEDAGGLIRQMNLQAPLEAVKAFCAFLEWMRIKYHDALYSVTFIPPVRRSSSTAGRAYGITLIASLYYFLFCEEAISEEGLIARACRDETSAHAWTYLSLHMVSALRDTDLARLPHPVLPCQAGEFLENVRKGLYQDTVYISALHGIMERLGYIRLTPNKERHHQGIPELALAIPQSLEPHFGRLFMICKAHLELAGQSVDSPLFKRVTSYSRIRTCLGERIGDLFRERDVSPVALAKSYLQSLETAGSSTFADKGLAAVHGYMLASMARSHKDGPAGFAETTAAYLRDFGLGIISPEQTARELFDRGILSCLPSMLLDLITGGAYKALDFSQQAQFLKCLSLSPLEVEGIMEQVLRARERSRQAMKDALSGWPAGDRQAAASKALERIAGYQAPGKQPDILCFMSALGKTCPDPAATNCLLCPFRIDTRAAVHQAAGELHRLLRLAREASTTGERKKYTLLARQCLLPAIQLASDIIQLTYGPQASSSLLSLLHSIMEHGLENLHSPGAPGKTDKHTDKEEP